MSKLLRFLGPSAEVRRRARVLLARSERSKTIGSALAALVVVGLFGWIARRFLPRRLVVEGPSMVPTLEDGDRLLVRPTCRLRLGDLAVFADPQAPGRLLVKRVAALDGTQVRVLGDNPSASRDSRRFGEVAQTSVLGIAIYRYAPPNRVGRLGRGPAGRDGPAKR